MEGNMESEGDVSIGQSGEFEGDIRARRVVVSGSFNGTIDCERLEIVSTGRVTGEIQVAELVIESGGHFSGSSRIKDAEPQRQLSHQRGGPESKPGAGQAQDQKQGQAAAGQKPGAAADSATKQKTV